MNKVLQKKCEKRNEQVQVRCSLNRRVTCRMSLYGSSINRDVWGGLDLSCCGPEEQSISNSLHVDHLKHTYWLSCGGKDNKHSINSVNLFAHTQKQSHPVVDKNDMRGIRLVVDLWNINTYRACRSSNFSASYNQ